MTLYAFKNGVTVLDETVMNSLLSLQEFVLVYEGTQCDAKTGSGTAEFDCASYDHAIRFTATGTTEVARVEFELVKHGAGADLVVEVRSDFNPDGSTEGTLLKKMTLPKEFIPASRSYWSIPIALEGLTSGSQYWFIVRGNGDATNHFHLHGETAQDDNYPCYYRARGGSEAWTAENVIHFKVFSSENGKILHSIEGVNSIIWLTYSGDLFSELWMYLPDSAGGPGLRQKVTMTYSNSLVKKGVVT